MSSRQSSGGGFRFNRFSSEPAIDLIGPSELPSSWPMTRISRCQAWRSCSRSGRLTSDSTSRSCGSPPSRNVVRLTSHRPGPPPAGVMSTTRGASPNHSLSDNSSAVRPSMCSMLLPISRSPVRLTMRSRCSESNANTATSICSITVRRSAVASTAPSRCSCSVSASALISIRAAPSGSSGFGGPSADGEVVLAKGREQIGQRLQRHDDARAHRGGQAEQCAQDDNATASIAPSACTAQSRESRAR